MLRPIKCIEFIGLPGCGKTSVANHLIAELRKHNKQPVSGRVDIDRWLIQIPRTRKIYWLLARPFKLLLNWWLALKVSIEVGSFNLNILTRALKLPIIDIFTQQYLRKHPHHLCVIDQNAVQNIWSIVAQNRQLPEISIEELVRYHIRQQYDTLYVYIASTAELASARISGRTHGNSRFETLSNQQRYIILENSQQSFDIICQAIRMETKPLLILDAEQSIEDKSQSIIQQYEHIRKDH